MDLGRGDLTEPFLQRQCHAARRGRELDTREFEVDVLDVEQLAIDMEAIILI
jgi:hypothetical protein